MQANRAALRADPLARKDDAETVARRSPALVPRALRSTK